MPARRPLALLTVALTLGAGARAGSGAPDDLAARALDRASLGLTDADRGMRYASAVALGKGAAPAERLAPALGDPEACVRYEAAWWLRHAGAQSLPTLERVLATGPTYARAAAAWALSGLGPGAAPLLSRALADPHPEVLLEAVAAVRRLGPPAAAPLRAAVEALAAPLRERILDRRMRPGDFEPTPASQAADAVEDDLAAECEATLAALAPPTPTPAPPAPATPSPRHAPTPTPTPNDDDHPDDDPDAEPTPPDPALAPHDFPALDRIDAVLALGASPADLPALDAALSDPERDVRLAATLALGRSRLDARPGLLRALDDPNARVRRAALATLGRHGAPPERLVPFLDDPTLPTSTTAREALRDLGPVAAEAVARRMARGGYAALHHGRLLFETWGPAAGAAAPILAEALRHDDVNVREDAARSLLALGPAAAPAAPALLAALRDPRLCVLAHAAVALGRIGLSEPLLAALDDPAARVRAYAMWAVAWALGDARGVAQVPFEMRLPVLDVGDPGPHPTALEVAAAITAGLASPDAVATVAAERRALLRRALDSKDRTAAVPAAAALTYKEVDAVEAERVMELLLPEGLRHGSPVDFDELRSLLGTTEVPACILYAARSRRLSEHRATVYGQLHRLPRAETLPFLAWFEDAEEAEVRERVGELWQPADRTLRFPDAAMGWLGLPAGASRDERARAALRDFVKDPSVGLGGPVLWAVRDFAPTADDTALLRRALDLALEAPPSEPHALPATAWTLLLALGRLTADATRARLREVIDDRLDADQVVLATAALARQGDANALDELVHRSRDAGQGAFAVLASLAPRRAGRALLSRLLEEADPLHWDDAVLVAAEAVESALQYGVTIPPETWLGLEAEVARRLDDPRRLWRVARSIPGLRTRRIAARLDALLLAAPPHIVSDDDEHDDEHDDEDDDRAWDRDTLREALGFLVTADPARTTTRLRSWAAFDAASRPTPLAGLAREVLVALRDEASRAALLSDPLAPWLTSQALARWPGPGPLAALWARIDAPARSADDRADDRDDDLDAVAQALGWPADVPLFNGGLAERERAPATEALRRGDLEALRALYPDPERLPGPGELPVWRRLGREALAGRREARRDFWSALRAGRYRWFHGRFEPDVHTLGFDPSTLPHWVEDLDSNCCRISDGLAHDAFEGNYDTPDVYDRHRLGVGGPVSAFVVAWMAHRAADWVENPLPDVGYRHARPHRLPAPE